MKNRIFRTLALGIGLTAIFATSGLNASTFYSGRVNIPFEFRVGKQVFNAGEYRVEQVYTREVAYLVDVKTGRRVQMLRPQNSSDPANIKLTFETNYGVRILKRMS